MITTVHGVEFGTTGKIGKLKKILWTSLYLWL